MSDSLSASMMLARRDQHIEEAREWWAGQNPDALAKFVALLKDGDIEDWRAFKDGGLLTMRNLALIGLCDVLSPKESP